MDKIYDYILIGLYAETAVEDFMELVETKIEELKYNPRIHVEIEKFDELQRRYRRIVVKKYIILYTIEEDYGVVYIAHMYHSSRNYLFDTSL